MHLSLFCQRVRAPLLGLMVLLFAANTGFSQMGISGPTCVTAGTQYSYTISGDWTNSTSMTWTVVGGTISGSSSGTPLPQITVTWSGSGYVKVVTSDPSSNVQVNVTVTTAVSAGSITPASQTINYNAVPGAISNSQLASGGSCSPTYVYQWQQSTNDVSWSNISGATGTGLSFSAGLTQTMYYRREVTETVSETSAYTSASTVIVNPQLLGQNIQPDSQEVVTGGTPAQLGGEPASGGGCSSYSYQWQYSTDGVNYTSVSSNGNGTSYNPPATAGMVFYRRSVSCNSQTAYSSIRHRRHSASTRGRWHFSHRYVDQSGNKSRADSCHFCFGRLLCVLQLSMVAVYQ